MKEILNNSQLELRREIWIVLSEFYLDVELTNDDFDRIASVFLKSGLQLDEIKGIDIMEVFPLLQLNLLSVAGVWIDFDKDWLIMECEKRYKRRNSIFYKLNCVFWNFFFYWMRKKYWNEIEKRMI